MPNLTSVIVYETSTTRSIKFWILLFFQPLSIVCSLCMFYHMLASRTQRQLLANQIVFVMLIVSFLSVTIDLSITLDFLRQGFVFSQSHAFCYFWMFIDYVLYTQGMLLMAWASIERHILVFSIQKLRSKKQKFFLHYFPILFCIIYPLIFYIYMILSYPCQQSFDYKLILCGTPCFKQISFVLNSYDTMIHSFTPTVITIISSLTLLIRVVRHKRRIQGQLFSWRKQYRMSIQLLTIACLYVLMNTPPYTIIAIRVFVLETMGAELYALFIYYLYYFLTLFLPFVCLGLVHDFHKRIKIWLQKILCRRLLNRTFTRVDVFVNGTTRMPTVYR